MLLRNFNLIAVLDLGKLIYKGIKNEKHENHRNSNY